MTWDRELTPVLAVLEKMGGVLRQSGTDGGDAKKKRNSALAAARLRSKVHASCTQASPRSVPLTPAKTRLCVVNGIGLGKGVPPSRG